MNGSSSKTIGSRGWTRRQADPVTVIPKMREGAMTRSADGSPCLSGRREPGYNLCKKSAESLIWVNHYPLPMHAPGTWTIEGLFAGRPASLLLFQAVRRFIESLGQVTIEATKTQVSFGTARKFAWVWLLQSSLSRNLMSTMMFADGFAKRIHLAKSDGPGAEQPGVPMTDTGWC